MEEAKKELKTTDNEILKIILLTYLSTILIGRGIFFVTIDLYEINQNSWYSSLTDVMNLRLLSLLPVVAGVLILTTIFSDTTQSHIIFMVGNLVAVFVYGFFAVTGVQYGSNWWTAYAQGVNLYVHILLIIWGVYVLWRKRQLMKSFRD